MRAIRGRSGANQRERRQSGRMTRRELKQTLSRGGRKWVREVWQAAARTSGDLNRLSAVTSPLGNRLVESYAVSERLAGGEIHRALRIATVAGYATRLVIAEPTGQPSLRPSAFELGAHPDVERLAADPDRLLEPVRAIATERFESVMTLPAEVWTSYVAIAASKLQGQLASGKELSWQLLTRSRIEQMLRYGYVMRCLDEAVAAEPEVRQPE
ncbi:MAG TPA: hypothetical protein VJU80_00380 [Solirubrobacteraceae bacterium]|nr:hypothetical protein [Solirubrobacteraceae bacterium]